MAQQTPPGALIFHPRPRHHHHTAADMSSSSCSTSSDDLPTYYAHHPRQRQRRRWGFPWPPVMFGHPELARGPAAVIPQPQPQPLPQQPRQYGYRRFRYQGGRRHDHARHCRRRGRHAPRPCVLTRCCRWLFGDPPERYCCDGSGGGGGGGGDCCGSRTASPTRHYEDEYWGHGRGSNNNIDTNNWAYGPDGRRSSTWRYGGPGGDRGYPSVGPGGTIEEVEEGRTASVTAAPAGGQDVQHNHFHLGDCDGRRDWYGAPYEDARERRDGFLGLLDREMDRHMINQDALNAREGRTLALLDRERDRDRGNTDVLDLLGRELSRRGGQKRRKDGDGRDGDASEESEGEGRGALRREIEALRSDLSKLTIGREGKASKKSKGKRDGSGTGAGRGRGRDAVSRSSRGQTSPVVGNNITFGGRTDTDDQDSEEDEDGEAGEESDDDHGSDDAETLPPDWARASGQDVRASGRALRRTGTPSDSPD